MKDWRFISNQNSIIYGINDAGIETFTANLHRSLVREIIQNSLDAAISGTKKPVEVDFSTLSIPSDSFPGIDTFRQVIEKCYESNKNEPDAKKFFGNAKNIVGSSEIKVLRISDHNTIGLEGSDTCEKGTSWSRLVKESGSSNKGQSSGGSFGIGKSAAFACSDLRTVFYSSLDTKGLKSNIGVAKLVSFEDEKLGGWTTGIGYYSNDEKFVAIPELAQFDQLYNRNESGTDIYILGVHLSDNWREEFIKSVLLDFLVALVKGQLIVRVQDDVLSKETLDEHMGKLNGYESDELADLLRYYHLLTSPDPKIIKIPLDAKDYGKKFGFKDGECTLYLKEGEGYNRKIMITRKAGMRILEQNRISGSIEFTGVLIIDGPQMNEAFKKMEVPSHDSWEPDRCRGEEKKYNDILKGLRKYLRDTVKNQFGKVNTTSMDAIGASDFLPDKPEGVGQDKSKKYDLSTRIKKLLGKEVSATKTKTKAFELTEIEPSDSGKGGGGEVEGKGNGGKGKHKGIGTGKGSIGGTDTGKDKGLKNISVKKRLICKDVSNGTYLLRMIVPSTAARGKLSFDLSGEQSDYKLPITDAKVLSENSSTTIDDIKENTVYLKNMKKGQMLKIEVNVDFDTHCMMEVEYYANKR